MTVVVVTADFELYHAIVNSLRDRDVEFTTSEVGESLPPNTAVIITGVDDQLEEVPSTSTVIRADASEPRQAVEQALAARHESIGRCIIGVDPGGKPGVAVLEGDVVVSAFQVPLGNVVDVIHRELEGTDDAVVRIGDGARLPGSRIINELQVDAIEIVDEAGTTPYVGAGARGMSDVLAAVNIARRKGESISERTIEPTQGELQGIKDSSREHSKDNRAIPERLARQVALGELSMEEALDEHRDSLNNAE